jgi:threonine aldolase
MEIIDLRSDTVTKPTAEMRKVMANAEVGDDVYGEDPSVNELQEYVADLLGKEAAIFVPSGTMGNQIAIAAQTKQGDEVIVESDSHIFYYETAGPSIISRVQLRCLPSETGMINEVSIIDAIRPDVYYYPRTSMICLESTHNRHGGSVITLDYIKRVAKIAKENHLSLHLDGARLWNTCIYKKVSPQKYVSSFDSINVCLSKGLGAPIGSLLVGSKDLVKEAKKIRKILGGGMRQVGVLAAAGLHALKHHYHLLENDHHNAQVFAKYMDSSDYFSIDTERVKTNIVIASVNHNVDPERLIEAAAKQGVLISSFGSNKIRFVFHFQVNYDDMFKAADILIKCAKELKYPTYNEKMYNDED